MAGLPVGELFEQFEAEPVASGTIGQIHRAVLGARGARNTGCPEGACVQADKTGISRASSCRK